MVSIEMLRTPGPIQFVYASTEDNCHSRTSLSGDYLQPSRVRHQGSYIRFSLFVEQHRLHVSTSKPSTASKESFPTSSAAVDQSMRCFLFHDQKARLKYNSPVVCHRIGHLSRSNATLLNTYRLHLPKAVRNLLCE